MKSTSLAFAGDDAGKNVDSEAVEASERGFVATPAFPLTPCAVERVFPIRIQDSKRSFPIPGPLSPAARSSWDFEAITKNVVDSVTVPITSGARSPQPTPPTTAPYPETPRVSTHQAVKEVSGPQMRYLTNKFSYLGGESQDPSTLPEGRKIFRCEDEPIHIPGAIQRFGALIAIKENEEGHFLVRIASENTKSIIDFDPEELFQFRCFTDLLPNTDKAEFLNHLRTLQENKSKTSPDVFSISLTSLKGVPIPLFCALHIHIPSNLVVCEFELDRDVFSPTHPPDSGLPEMPIRILNHPATDAIRLLSTTSKSTPIHAVTVARKSARGLGPMEMFYVLSDIQKQLSGVETLPELLDIIVGLVHELTSFHRVMVYQFDETAAGVVVSEFVDTRASTDIYRGLHFPASDIPKQARELYMINTVRVLYDRTEDTARLVCRSLEDALTPLDLKHSYLRAMSPIHLKYLENMGVQASMSISLIVNGALWGLVACHSYGVGMRVSLLVRELCRGLGDIASSSIEKVLYLSRLKSRKIMSKAPPTTSPSTYIAASSLDLLNMFGADMGFLVIKDEARTIGKLFAYNESIILLQNIRRHAFTSIFHSNCIERDLQNIEPQYKFSIISGILIIPLALSGSDFLVFVRKGKLKEVSWAGNPNEKMMRPGTSYLEPRSSFARWSESVVGTSREWTEDEVESAMILSTLYGRFIEVWRQKEAIVQKNRITRLLIRNAGHEVRTPLSSIINYLEVALEETLDERARFHLERSLQASKSLVFVINDLLNLTEAEDSDFDVFESNLDLRSLIYEVISAFAHETAKKKIDVVLEDDQSVPRIVRSDPAGLRQVVSNLLSNAIAHSAGCDIVIGLSHLGTTKTTNLIEISFQDKGVGLSEEQLDAIFQDFEKIIDDDDGAEKTNPGLKSESDEPQKSCFGIGVGLATAGRFVRLNQGQISIFSPGLGQGTRVALRIPFTMDFQSDYQKSAGLTSISIPATSAGQLLSQMKVIPSPSPSTGSGPGSKSPDTSSKDLTSSSVLGTTPIELGPPGSSSNSNVAANRYPFPVTSAWKAKPKFNILIAEDNPLNSRLLENRLTKVGHTVYLAADGAACFSAFKDNSAIFDVILMDIQMPILDGVESTRHIRNFERDNSPPVSARVALFGRIPIIAVSASLAERSRRDYLNIGFDGWILKPINFKRLMDILNGIEIRESRESMLYINGSWEKGGWFGNEMA